MKKDLMAYFMTGVRPIEIIVKAVLCEQVPTASIISVWLLLFAALHAHAQPQPAKLPSAAAQLMGLLMWWSSCFQEQEK